MILKPWVALLLLLGLPLTIESEEAPWDFGIDHDKNWEVDSETPSLENDLLVAILSSYRDNSGKVSIHRCAFEVSCSHFAEIAVNHYGFFLGTIAFMDRYFYRENTDSPNFYPTRGKTDGTYRLDDKFFVP